MTQRPILSALWVLAAVCAAASGSLAGKRKTGDAAPNFQATGLDGRRVTLDSFKAAKVLVICFTCNGCPFARAYEDRLIEFVRRYRDRGVQLVAINVNRAEDLEAMKQRAEEKQFNFAYVYDPSGRSAAAYGARVTPHLFVVQDGKIAYQGSFDDRMRRPTKPYLARAVEALLQGKKPEVTETKPFGSGITNPAVRQQYHR